MTYPTPVTQGDDIPMDETTINTGESFRADRWRRAGATEQQIANLQAEWAGKTPELRNAESAWIDQVADGELRDKLLNLPDDGLTRNGVPAGAIPAPVAPENADEHLLEQEALNGPWDAVDPIDVGGVIYPLWNLANEWVGTRIGDAQEGMHLVAPTLDELINRVQHEVSHEAAPAARTADLSEGAAAWQREKHLADLRARSAG